MKRLYLLRHGQTEFNVKKLVQGRCDSPLTDLGRQQARAAAAWLKAHGVAPDKVVSSPLGRAMDTAQLVACELIGPDAAVEPCKGIIERCYGTFEEGPHDALPTDIWDPGEDLVPFGGEGSRALQERMVDTLTNQHGRRGHRNPPGSKPRQRQPPIHQGCSPRGLRATSKTPQLRHHDLRF